MSSKSAKWFPLTELVEWVDGKYGAEASEGVVMCLAKSMHKHPDLASPEFKRALMKSLNQFALSRDDFPINYIIHDLNTEIFECCRIVNVLVEFCADNGARHETAVIRN